jgi:eukaryotic-like serine/threonine-protein kinase
MNYQASFTLSPDALLLPVLELPEETRSRLECEDGDFALSRPSGRSGSKILDADSAALVRKFEQPRSVAEAVILLGREQGSDPAELLEEAFPFLKGLIDAGFLVPEAAAVPTAALAPGAIAGGWQLRRTLQQLEDTEVFLAERAGAWAALKIARPLPGDRRSGVEARLEREAAFLRALDGAPVARLLDEGVHAERRWLALSFEAGVEAAAAAAERLREGGRPALLALLQAIARAYAALHTAGVLHGDVHGRNLLVDAEGRVVLLDFGLARALDERAGLPTRAERGGVPFFFEPELAAAYLAGARPPLASEVGEQHAVATLLYQLAAGAFPHDYSLGREAMLRELAEAPPQPFAERGAEPWPALEAVLARALAKDPAARFASLAELAAALAAVDAPAAPSPAPTATELSAFTDAYLASAGLDGPWLGEGLAVAPTASINYGAAGVAVGLLAIADRRRDGRLLALADLWAERAAADGEADAGFYSPVIDITREICGEASPYHTPSGVAAAQALVAAAAGDRWRYERSVARYAELARRPAAGLDLTLGRASTLLGATLLLERCPSGAAASRRELELLGTEQLAAIWAELDAEPEIAQSRLDYLGVAHGWAGFLYATLAWCQVAEAPLPGAVEARLHELAAFALPSGRGLVWPWQHGKAGEPATMPGWCNGGCGYVFLWTLAHAQFPQAGFLRLAVGAGEDAWAAHDGVGQLCCGLAGRGYALLNLARATGDERWRGRAHALAARGVRHGKTHGEHPHSLYKGQLGLAALAADLERPDEARMPFFEIL